MKRLFIILVLVLSMVVAFTSYGVAFAEQGPDKEDKEHKHSKKDLEITSVFVDFNLKTIVINGRNFTHHGRDHANGHDPVVKMGDMTLKTLSVSLEMIVAALPDGIKDGDYLLTVMTGQSESQYDEYDLTIGSVGPQGPAGPQGSAGPRGPSGVLGITVRTYQFSISPKTLQETSVSCAANEVVTGGGFQITDDPSLFVWKNRPDTTNKDWDIGISNYGSATRSVTIYAVCVQAP